MSVVAFMSQNVKIYNKVNLSCLSGGFGLVVVFMSNLSPGCENIGIHISDDVFDILVRNPYRYPITCDIPNF